MRLSKENKKRDTQKVSVSMAWPAHTTHTGQNEGTAAGAEAEGVEQRGVEVVGGGDWRGGEGGGVYASAYFWIRTPAT